MDYQFPFAVEKNTNRALPLEASIAANFISIHKRIKSEAEKIVKMAEILWPVMFIQSEPNFKLMIDNVGVSLFEGKVTNSPRTAQIGHILRNQELDIIERLEKVKDVMNFLEVKEGIAVDPDVSGGLFVHHKIAGLFSPRILQAVADMFKFAHEVTLSQFDLLDTKLNFDEALDAAQTWVKLLKSTHGTRMLWKSLEELIREPVDKWKLDLKVKKKDLEYFYKNKIKNAQNIDETLIKDELNKAKDNVDHWVLKEQKSIIERISKMFARIDFIFDDIREKNKPFLQTDSLKTKKVGEVVVEAYQNIADLRAGLEKSDQELKRISASINEIREQLEKTSMSAEEKINLLDLELKNKKEQQEQEVNKLLSEKEEKLGEIQQLVDKLDSLEKEVFDIIAERIESCNTDEINLRKWELNDEVTHIRNPTAKFYIPIGIAIIEDVDMDERIEITFPSLYGEELKREHFSAEIQAFEKKLSEILEDDMKLRSNFEFTCEKSKDYKPAIAKGLGILFEKGLINIKMKQKYASLLEELN